MRELVVLVACFLGSLGPASIVLGEEMAVTRRQAAAAIKGAAAETATSTSAREEDAPTAERGGDEKDAAGTFADAGEACAAAPKKEEAGPKWKGLLWVICVANAVAFVLLKIALRFLSNHAVVSLLVLPVPFVKSVPVEGFLLFFAFFVAASEVGSGPY